MISSPKDDTIHNLQNASHNIGDAVGNMKEDVCATANKTGQKARGLIDSAGGEISHATDTVATHIKDKPVQSSMIALGVGFMIGMLFSR